MHNISTPENTLLVYSKSVLSEVHKFLEDGHAKWIHSTRIKYLKYTICCNLNTEICTQLSKYKRSNFGEHLSKTYSKQNLLCNFHVHYQYDLGCIESEKLCWMLWLLQIMYGNPSRKMGGISWFSFSSSSSSSFYYCYFIFIFIFFFRVRKSLPYLFPGK